MIEISVSNLLLAAAKCAGLAVIGAFAAMFILWPIGDQKTSKTQWAIYVAVMLLATDLMFWGAIKWGQ